MSFEIIFEAELLVALGTSMGLLASFVFHIHVLVEGVMMSEGGLFHTELAAIRPL